MSPQNNDWKEIVDKMDYFCCRCLMPFSDEEKDEEDDDRCPKCLIAFSQMPYEPPHEIADCEFISRTQKIIIKTLLNSILTQQKAELVESIPSIICNHPEKLYSGSLVNSRIQEWKRNTLNNL